MLIDKLLCGSGSLSPPPEPPPPEPQSALRSLTDMSIAKASSRTVKDKVKICSRK